MASLAFGLNGQFVGLNAALHSGIARDFAIILNHKMEAGDAADWLLTHKFAPCHLVTVSKIQMIYQLCLSNNNLL